MVETASIRLLRVLQEKGYTMLVSGRMYGPETNFFFPERIDMDLRDHIYAMPMKEDHALSITDALRWLTDNELKEVCVIISA